MDKSYWNFVFLYKKENIAKPLKYIEVIRHFLSRERRFTALNRQKMVAILSV